jgi:hypothetical protein
VVEERAFLYEVGNRMDQEHDKYDFLPDLQLPLGHWEGFGQRSALTLLETLPPGVSVDPALAASMIQETLALLEKETLGMVSEDRKDAFVNGMRAVLLKDWKGAN